MLVLAEVYHHRTEGDTDYDSDVPLDALPPPGTQSIFVYSLHPLQPSYGAESPRLALSAPSCEAAVWRPPSGDRLCRGGIRLSCFVLEGTGESLVRTRSLEGTSPCLLAAAGCVRGGSRRSQPLRRRDGDLTRTLAGAPRLSSCCSREEN